MRYYRYITYSILLMSALLFTFLRSGAGNSPEIFVEERRAFATFMSSRASSKREFELDFNAVRSLVYQIVHQPSTRSGLGTPIVVFALPDMADSKRKILEDEGARVITVQPVHSTDQNSLHSFSDELAILRLFEQTEYDRILFIQPYVLLTRSLDAIWEEKATRKLQMTRNHGTTHHTGETPVPRSYLFSSVSSNGRITGFNPGFWIARPDQMLFNYYVSLVNSLNTTSGDSTLLDVLGYSHHASGNMPWGQLRASQWNTDVSSYQGLPSSSITIYIDFGLVPNPSAVNKMFLDVWWETQNRMMAFWCQDRPSLG